MVLTPDVWQQTIHNDRLLTLMSRHADRSLETWLTTPRPLWVDRERAAFGAWYEAFPRSWGPAGHGCFVMRRIRQLLVTRRDRPALGWVRSRFSTGLALRSTSMCICMPA